MSEKRRYVCAFRGRRDDYQVPLALHEAGMLHRFITDFYAGEALQAASRLLPGMRGQAIRGRSKEGLPGRLVSQFPAMAAKEALAGAKAPEVRDRHDVALSLAAAREARRGKADLFLYSAYAADAFQAQYDHNPRKILFQYHPHHGVEQEILAQDARSHFGATFSASDFENVTRAQRVRSDDAWQSADTIICASSFTAQSLVAAGAPAEKLHVASYGIAPQLHEPPPLPRGDDHFRVLFAGSAIQRKGIHHLLQAWEMADLPRGSGLTIVARSHDPQFFDPARLPANCRYLGGVEAQQLQALYAGSALFCMPSLIEGFGQVYLESLSAGLPVLGTANTCLPDLGSEDSGVFTAPPGDAASLARELERLSRLLPGNMEIKERARDLAATLDWESFRNRIASLCEAG